MSEEEGLEGTRQGEDQNEQGKPTAASRDVCFHKIIPGCS